MNKVKPNLDLRTGLAKAKKAPFVLVETHLAALKAAEESGYQRALAAVERHVLGTERLAEGHHTASVLDRTTATDPRAQAALRLEEANWWYHSYAWPPAGANAKPIVEALDRIAKLEAAAATPAPQAKEPKP